MDAPADGPDLFADLAAPLRAGLAALGVAVDARDERGGGAVQTLVDYLRLLARWNRVYNLTAVRDPREMVSRHLLDSLTALPFVHGERLLDLGSGAGLPGVPLALLRPQWQVALLDGNGKKARFLRQAALELRLDNVAVIEERAERFRPATPFSTVVARAYAPLDRLARDALPLLKPGGRLIALKGRPPALERALPPECALQAVWPVSVPGLTAERCIVVVVKKGARRA